MDNIETLHHKKTVAADIVGFKFEADLFKPVPMFLGLAALDSTETFHNQKMVVAETGGFRFEADLFKSVPMIPGFGRRGQNWDVSQSENGCCRDCWFQIRSRLLRMGTDYHSFWLS